jgi:AraC-like DNA-binding protein
MSESSQHAPDLIPPFAYTMSHGDEMPMHQHAQGQLVYPATGVLSVSTTSGTWIAPANRAVWTPAGFEHGHSAYGTTDMRAIHVPDDLARALPDRPAVMAVSPLLREVLMALTDEVVRHRDASDRLVRVAVDELVEAPEEPLHLPEPNDDRLRAVTDLLHANPADDRGLAKLGQIVGASERTLSRLFQTELHMGFRQWRTQLRIHHALVHLAAGDTITQTSVACGWSNPSTFIEAFSASLGKTPGRYRSDATLTDATTLSHHQNPSTPG